VRFAATITRRRIRTAMASPRLLETVAACVRDLLRRRRLARHVPILNQATASVLEYAHRGSRPLILATTLANGVGEEVFFRGAVYAAAGIKYPVPKSTAVYTLAATAIRNPALVLASGFMGALFARQRRASGGIQVSILTHLTWSTLMLRYLPPLFPDITTATTRSGDLGAFTRLAVRERSP
jgi:hypothetical protein